MAHPGYEVKRPFTMLRYVLVGMILEIVNRDPQQLDALTVELWKVLCSWFFRYPHNNLYHSIFYKLVFKTLRCNNVGALRMAVSKGRLVAQLVDSHVDGDKVGPLLVCFVKSAQSRQTRNSVCVSFPYIRASYHRPRRWSSWYPRNLLAAVSRVRISARTCFLSFVPGSGMR